MDTIQILVFTLVFNIFTQDDLCIQYMITHSKISVNNTYTRVNFWNNTIQYVNAGQFVLQYIIYSGSIYVTIQYTYSRRWYLNVIHLPDVCYNTIQYLYLGDDMWRRCLYSNCEHNMHNWKDVCVQYLYYDDSSFIFCKRCILTLQFLITITILQNKTIPILNTVSEHTTF